MTSPITNSCIDRPNKIKNSRVVWLILLMPLIAPAYLVGIVFALLHVSAFCGYKNTEKCFMVGLGYETEEQILTRLVEKRLK